MVRMLLKLLKALNSNASPWQLAFGIAFGAIVGLSPFYSLHNLLVLLIVFVVRVNMSAFFASILLFTGFAYLIDVQAIKLGESLLSNPEYLTMWTNLYQSELWRLTHFNHTLTLGSLVIALVLFIPLLLASKVIITTYRHHIMAWFGKLKVVQMLKANKLYSLYHTLAD